MTEHQIESTVPAEVRDFVAHVREQLADLDAEEQQELTAGLEADLTDLVVDRGTDALEDPVAYARELRTAAGRDPAMGARPAGRSIRDAAIEAIDATHQSWNRLLDSMPGDLRGFLDALQPTWWVVRGGTAWLVIQDIRGPYIVFDWTWLALLVVCVVVSVQLGRRVWGFDRLLDASVLARLLLVSLNVFAVTMVPGAVDRLAWHVAEMPSYQVSSSVSGTGADRGASVVFSGPTT